jgi:branched-chain amino acid transport system substrate-binding protein
MPTHAIRLGLPIALSGRYALQGRQCLAGLKCYVRAANAEGGIFLRAAGRRLPLELRIYDDRSEERAAGRLTDRLIRDDRVDLLFGPYGSGPVRAAAAMAHAHGQVLWNHSGAAVASAGGGRSWVVSILAPASRYLCAILDLVKTVDPELRRVALYRSTTGFAAEVAAGARVWMEGAGVTLVVDRPYRSGDDVRFLVDRPASDRADIILGVGRIEHDIRLARRLLEARPPVKAVGVVAAAIGRFRDDVGSRADGFLAPSQWEPQVRYPVRYGPSATEFRDRYLATAAVPIDYPAAQAYAAGLVAQRCLESAGTLAAGAVRDAAARLHVTTFYGPYGIDPPSGIQVAHQMLVTQWQGGKKVVVWPPELAEAEPCYPAPPWA